MTIMILTGIQFSLIVAVVGYLTINMLHMVQVEPAGGRLTPSPLVSVCVPARNEERDIEACLVSLLEQDYPSFEVIVVDDNSTDATPEILRSLQKKFPNLVLLQGASLPEGWYGKPFALHHGFFKREENIFPPAGPDFLQGMVHANGK